MSWSGPVAGATPYQAAPYANNQSGYGQHPPHQYGQHPTYGQYQQGPPYPGPPQRSHDSRPPKKKGNPIITRYPPPPGYRGPAQPQGHYHTAQHSAQYQAPPQPGFPQVPPAQPTYPVQAYAAAPPQQVYPPPHYGPPQASTYPPSYPQGQNYQWPLQSFQPGQPSSQPSLYPGTQGYAAPNTSYPPYPARTTAVDAGQQAYNHVKGWSRTQSQPNYPLQNQYNGQSGSDVVDQPMTDSNATPTPATAHLGQDPSTLSSRATLHDNTTDQKPELYLAWDDWDFDFDGAIWPKSNEPVDPNLSLGVIIWHPAKQVTRALPATFEEAEEQSLKPTPEKLGNGESVSIYFTTENSHEAFLNVRQTDEWDCIKDDPAFVTFADEEMQNNLVPIEDCIAQRDRPDELVDLDASTADAEMHEADWSVMDHLEQVLSASGEKPRSTSRDRTSQHCRPQTQEDILASLGVTGLPKPVSEESVPFPAPVQEIESIVSLPEKPSLPLQSSTISRPQAEQQRSQSLSGAPASSAHSLLQRSYGSISSSIVGPPPPPPPPPEQNRYDPWNPSNRHQQYHAKGFNGGRGSPARSEASNGTAAGSDFGIENPTDLNDISLTPGSKSERNDSSASRKRSYGDTDADDDRVREHDDHTKRKRRSQVDAAYG
ncbi:hypothetical protein C7974DRAFT_67525 [Boeremia exigua]|uniref:uncharacterized protein n=1 Tax=Boeremia exigua TaxID=749465 RepID=UPI001E8DB0E3|nr:uncharacterized protein C7974DRAFT_67525 [Boeremia exigua]KAH6613965.1 hypothetical protein C7974DRAFT_67525 [Boeremia exigua]